MEQETERLLAGLSVVFEAEEVGRITMFEAHLRRARIRYVVENRRDLPVVVFRLEPSPAASRPLPLAA